MELNNKIFDDKIIEFIKNDYKEYLNKLIENNINIDELTFDIYINKLMPSGKYFIDVYIHHHY